MADISETSGGEDGSYFDGCLLNTMEILVKDIEKRSGEKLKEPYIVYMIETRCFSSSSDEENQSSCLWRRYSEFDMLRNYLQTTYPGLIIPPLPEKKSNLAAFRLNSDNYNMEFVERRRNGLEFFLHRIAKHPQLGLDEYFKSFLTQEEVWKESIIATGFQSKADSKLKSLSASFSVKKPDKKYEDIKNYSQTLQGNIASLLKVQQKISEKQFSIHKEHANYGKIFSEWSSIEDEMGHALQKAGHYMDK
ncbi:Sorting nexin-4 [Paramuricea clavata]|uniref:Sorting nexin-4 n=1 Tax=Paramuricea clavata TaxID=317549 RepID=A0A7D9E192_PARCT|nr:Sorting nexin-4 [Paramuricea clavata]